MIAAQRRTSYSRARARAAILGLITLVSVACKGEVADLPPHGEALFVVDTDLPVPALAGRLRVDLYSESGAWFESRDTARSDPRDWPASFGVFSDDESRERSVLVRLRVYPEGAIRDYQGERFAPRVPYQPPKVAATLAELCEAAPTLAIGDRITQRAGLKPLTEIVPYHTCEPPNRGGSVAARVDITRAGKYRFSAARLVPNEAPISLFLRTRCDDPASQISCRTEPTADPQSSGHLPRLDVTLQPGTYFLMTGSTLEEWSADVTLEVMALGDDAEGDPPPLPPLVDPRASAPAEGLRPRLERPGQAERDATPTNEPLPTATVDRLVLVRLTPGKRGVVPITLRGDCAGTMARLGQDPTKPDFSNAETCIGREAAFGPIVETPLSDEPAPKTSEQGSFAGTPGCDAAASTSSVACIPGGAFLLGSRLLTELASSVAEPSPERIARMSRFYLDRYEVSVARMRDALTRGFVLDDRRIRVNDGAYAIDPPDPQFLSYCSFSREPAGREDLPVTCIAWSLAREFCQFSGGDLPTEAQWEYAATAAGRPLETRMPWGDEPPTCARAAYARALAGVGAPVAGDCLATVDGGRPADVGPTSVHAHDGSDGLPGDVTPQGVVALAGNVTEWVRDAAESYRSPCWAGAPLDNPSCEDESAPRRSLRGSNWMFKIPPMETRLFGLSGISAGYANPFAANPQLGFRCAYSELPR